MRRPILLAERRTLTSLTGSVIGSTRLIAETSHVLRSYGQRASPLARIHTSRSLAQEDVVGGVGYAEIRAGGGAGALHRTAARIDALDGGDTGQHAVAAPFDDFELQQRDVARRSTGCAPGKLRRDDTAVRVLPMRSGVVPPDGLARLDKRRDRLPELPDETPGRVGLAFVHLSPFGVQGKNGGFARLRDSVRQ